MSKSSAECRACSHPDLCPECREVLMRSPADPAMSDALQESRKLKSDNLFDLVRLAHLTILTRACRNPYNSL